MEIITYDPDQGAIFRDTAIIGDPYTVYYSNGQGCSTNYFKSVNSGRKALLTDRKKTGRDWSKC